MAYIKYAGEEAVGRIADYVNKKLAFASSMPESPDANTIVMYVGSNTASHKQGGIYQYDGTEWNLINLVKTIELTQAEYDALPSAVKLNGTIYFISDGSADGSIISGYYNETDGEFYAEETYETQYDHHNNTIYIDLSNNTTYIYDFENEEYVQVGGGGSGIVIKYVSTLPVTGIEDIIYGIKEYNSFEETIANGFLDENELFEKENDLSGGYIYTPAEDVILDASDDGTTYKGFTSLAYDGTSDWTLTFDDTTNITLADGDTFYFKQSVDKFFAGDATNQKVIPLNNTLDDYYDKNAVDDLLDTKQNTLTFDNTPISGSSNPVTSAGIKTALDNILISGNGGSIIKVHHTAGAAAAGNTVTASKGSYSVSSTFDASGDAIIIGFGEIGNITITATNGSESGSIIINIPNFSVYTARINYGLDYESWLVAGGIDPSYYESLDEVLEDEEVVRRLMTLHASVDYLTTLNNTNDEMAITVLNNDICAKWINLRDYALDTLYANEYTKAIMDEADKYGYGEWAIVPLSQPMTDNAHPVGALSYYNFPGFSGTYKDILYKGVNHYPSSSEANSQLIASQPWSSKSTADSYIVYTFPKKSRPVRLSYCTIAPTVVSSVINVDHSISIYGMLDENETLLREESIVVNTETQEPSYIFSFDLEPDKEYDGIKLVFHGSNSFRPSYGDYNTLINYFVVYEWGPKGNIPAMTNYSAPYGTALASSEYNTQSFNAWRAFDQNPLDRWVTSQGATSGWIQYKFMNPICVKRFMIRHTPSSAELNQYLSIIIQGSNDGSTFTNIQTYTSGFPTTVSESKCFDVTNDEYYLYLRLSVVSQSNYVVMSEIQFYGREMKVSVPTMTSATAPYGTVSCSGIYNSSYADWMAFDSNESTYFHSTGFNEGDSVYVQYKFTKPVIIKRARLKPMYTSSYGLYGKTYKIQGSNDNFANDIHDLYSDVFQNVSGIDKTASFDNEQPYLYYRVLGTDSYCVSGGKWYCAFYTVQFFGFDYSERDWDTEYPMTYLYDHGVEPTDVITSIANASGNTFVKEPSRLTINKTTTSAWNAMYPTNQINVTDYTLARAVSTDGTGINGTASLATCSNLSTGATDSYKVMAANLAPYNQYNDMTSVNTSRWITIGFGTNVTGNIAISEWWLEQ